MTRPEPKYEPLRRFLETAPHPVTMTFGQIAQLVGGLPPSAYRHRPWWANSRGTPVEAAAWLDVQRVVVAVELAREVVTFS